MPGWKPNFDVSDPLVPVRVLCGVLHLPHIAFKLGNIAGAVTFFGKAGLNPPLAFVVLALVMETACAVALTLGVMTKWAGFVSAAVMAVAAYAVLATKGHFIWLWNLGGIEYIALWAALSVLVAVHAWRQEKAAFGRFHLLAPAPRAA